ncbi:hypothetical protein O6H91_Y165100 [Diphasiastrum complanatum]|nr:hypothetical protein O6H91_Y165100 [Diphasiastrum complanatum]
MTVRFPVLMSLSLLSNQLLKGCLATAWLLEEFMTCRANRHQQVSIYKASNQAQRHGRRSAACRKPVAFAQQRMSKIRMRSWQSASNCYIVACDIGASQSADNAMGERSQQIEPCQYHIPAFSMRLNSMILCRLTEWQS